MSEPAPGLIPWLTVRHHRDSTGIYWRRGVFLRHRIAAYGSEALIELRGSTELAVQVRAPSPDMYFNVLRDSIEDLITRRWPGLRYRLYIPCPGPTTDGSPCPGTFPLDGLIRQREGGQATVACMDCPATPDISALLTGFAAPTVPLAAELQRSASQLARASPSASPASRDRPPRSPTPSVACTRSSAPRSPTALACSPSHRRALPESSAPSLHQDHYRLTLWCEHPGYEHPWEPATYNLDLPKEWLTRIAPYALLVFQTLQLIVPLAGAVAIAALPSAQQASAQNHLEVMKAIVADLPATQQARVEGSLSRIAGSSPLPKARRCGPSAPSSSSTTICAPSVGCVASRHRQGTCYGSAKSLPRLRPGLPIIH